MSSILEEGINFDNLPITTDVIISHYENKLNERIADKTVKASKAGVAPVFTQEEWLYLNKKSIPANPDAEITVITPSPTITLKKGNTEINVKNAAALVQKMQEMYPNGMSEYSEEEMIKQSAVKDEPKSTETSDMFKKFVNFDVRNVSPEVSKAVAPDVETFQKSQFSSKVGSDIKSVNKNAYEIRTEVLKMSIDFIRWQTEMGAGNLKESSCVNIPNIDDTLEMAKKFYSFVENRR